MNQGNISPGGTSSVGQSSGTGQSAGTAGYGQSAGTGSGPSSGGSGPGSTSGGSKTQQAAASAKTAVEQLKGAAREQGSAAVEQLKSGAQSSARQVQEAGRSFIANQKQGLAQKVDDYAEAVRAASERLGAEDGNMLAGPAQRAAEQLERVSAYLRDKEPGDLLTDLETFARRRPEVVFGGLFIAGLAAARFLKASRKDSSREQQWNQNGTRQYGASAGAWPASPGAYAPSPATTSSHAWMDDPYGTAASATADATLPTP